MWNLSIIEFLFLVWMGGSVCEVFIKSLLTCYKIRSGVYDKDLDTSARFWSAHSDLANKAKNKCGDSQFETP
jgi:hypothetical protein